MRFFMFIPIAMSLFFGAIILSETKDKNFTTRKERHQAIINCISDGKRAEDCEYIYVKYLEKTRE